MQNHNFTLPNDKKQEDERSWGTEQPVSLFQSSNKS